MFLLQCFLTTSFVCVGEIDRCLKKVAEGVEQFEDIWQKVRFLFIFMLSFYGIIYSNNCRCER